MPITNNREHRLCGEDHSNVVVDDATVELVREWHEAGAGGYACLASRLSEILGRTISKSCVRDWVTYRRRNISSVDTISLAAYRRHKARRREERWHYPRSFKAHIK